MEFWRFSGQNVSSASLANVSRMSSCFVSVHATQLPRAPLTHTVTLIQPHTNSRGNKENIDTGYKVPIFGKPAIEFITRVCTMFCSIMLSAAQAHMDSTYCTRLFM